jgi:hypothetical protein
MRSIISKISIAVISAAIAAPVTAGLIYTWESDSGTNATGQIEFADYVHLGDVIDPDTDISSKSFSFMRGTETLTLTDFYFFIGEVNVEVSSLGLCVPSCIDPNDGSTPVKKKAAIKTKGPSVAMYGSDFYVPTWEWTSNVLVEGSVDPYEYYQGTGRWNLTSVPEPETVLLFLSGLVSFSIIRKKITSKN